jgi:predicted ABC-type ATPase
MKRVQTRVAKGGHNIPEDVIRRRYEKGLQNFVNLFMPLCDEWMIADNSQSEPTVIAKGKSTYAELIINKRRGIKS